jgi:hypothetical protein
LKVKVLFLSYFLFSSWLAWKETNQSTTQLSNLIEFSFFC